MKNKIFLIVPLLLFATGCTCQYNLTIDGDIYKEEVIIIGTSTSEISNFNKKWQVPIDKETYNIGIDPSSSLNISDIYKYKISGNKLIFSNDFYNRNYSSSAAVSNCYNKLAVSTVSGSTILSTSPSAVCFDNNPNLTSVTVNITVDRKVIKHNADRVNGRTYTWNLSRSNNKGINIILENSTKTINEDTDKTIVKEKEIKPDYTMYIFALVLFVLFLFAYFIVNIIKNKDDSID